MWLKELLSLWNNFLIFVVSFWKSFLEDKILYAKLEIRIKWQMILAQGTVSLHAC